MPRWWWFPTINGIESIKPDLELNILCLSMSIFKNAYLAKVTWNEGAITWKTAKMQNAATHYTQSSVFYLWEK